MINEDLLNEKFAELDQKFKNTSNDLCLQKSQKTLFSFRVEKEIKELADRSILLRATLRNKSTENFSEYLRNLILEDYKRNKASLINTELV